MQMPDDELRGAILQVGRWYRAVLYRNTDNGEIDHAYLLSRDEAAEWLRVAADEVYRQVEHGHNTDVEVLTLKKRAIVG